MSLVRASKYRHVYGQPVKKDQCFDNIRLTKNAFDSNLAKSNGHYISLCWNASGGGAFAVMPVDKPGKLPDRFPLFSGHKGAVLDTDWSPFDDNMVVSASDDGTIGVWRVPTGFDPMSPPEDLDNVEDVEATKFLKGHSKKVGHVLFSPLAENVLASSSLDHTIKIWDVETGDLLFTLEHPDVITSFTWSYDGNQIASTCRDKKIRIWDVRAEKVVSEGTGHAGSKATRVVWLGDRPRIATTGFSRLSDRQLAIWDTEDLEKGPIGDFKNLDQSSGIIMPFFDAGTSILYLGGRGDGTIVYYELVDDKLYDLFSYQSTAPQRGLAFIPDRALDIHDHEVARVYKVWETQIEPVPFRVPRKIEGFLSDIYKTCHSGTAALSAKEWASGKTSRPLVDDWKDIYDGKKPEPKEAKKPVSSEPKKAKASETKEPEAKKPEVKEPEVKPAKAEAKSEAKKPETVKSQEVSPLDKAQKQDAYEVFQSKEVKSFLEKAGSEELEKPTVASREDSAWDDELEEAKAPSRKESESKSEQTEPKSEKTEPKSEKTEPKFEKTEPKSGKTELKSDKAEPKPEKTEPKSEPETKPESNGTAKAISDLDAEANDVMAKASKAKAKLEELKARKKPTEPSEDLQELVHRLAATVDALVERVERLEQTK